VKTLAVLKICLTRQCIQATFKKTIILKDENKMKQTLNSDNRSMFFLIAQDN